MEWEAPIGSPRREVVEVPQLNSLPHHPAFSWVLPTSQTETPAESGGSDPVSTARRHPPPRALIAGACAGAWGGRKAATGKCTVLTEDFSASSYGSLCREGEGSPPAKSEASAQGDDSPKRTARQDSVLGV